VRQFFPHAGIQFMYVFFYLIAISAILAEQLYALSTDLEM
jgi:hypothetical protein